MKTEVEQFLDALIENIDLGQELRLAFLDGFDNVKDYEKYGDAFIPLVAKDTE